MADKHKRGLGTGLGALLKEDPLANETDGALNLPIEKVEPRIDQPRNVFNEESLNELADSILKYGIIQPLTVRRLDSGYYQIIAGERRWRAARIAGLIEVPVRVVEADDKRVMELALVENLQREDLNPIEEAKGYKTLMEDFGMTQDGASKSVGRSRPAIANALRLLALSPPVMAMVEDGDISAGHARALIPIKDEAQQLRIATKIYDENLSVRQVENLVSKILKETDKIEETIEKTTDIEVDYLAETEKKLTTVMGRRVNIKDGRKKGKIIIEYYGADDRELLINALAESKASKGGTGI